MTATLDHVARFKPEDLAALDPYTPVVIGPTWQRDPGWDGVDPLGEFVLPSRTLGWQILQWISENVNSPDGDGPFVPTREQARFLLWWYAVDEHGDFTYRHGVLQRLKGWGKDPLAAVICIVEFVGPCRFDHWAEKDLPELGLSRGDPVAIPNPAAWIQLAAVTGEQNVNTMSLFPAMFSEKCMRDNGMNDRSIGKTVIYAYGGSRRIQIVTKNPRALEGGRPTFVLMNEVHQWIETNSGHAMYDVIERNAVKSKGGKARSLAITNAYNPAEASIGQRLREAYEDMQSGETVDTGWLYDSLEASPNASLRPKKKRRSDPEPTPEQVMEHLKKVLVGVRGDAVWLDIPGIVASIMSPMNSTSRSLRFWFNCIVAAEDSWADPAAINAAIHPLARAYRRDGSDELRAGWQLVGGDEPCTMFFDGSKSDDATGLAASRLSDGYTFTLGVWQPPPKIRNKQTYLVPREQVDKRVDEVFERFQIVGFYADPSHAKDDEVEVGRYWDPTIDRWHLKYGARLPHWAVRSGDYTHSIMWDMTSPQRQAQFVAEAERFVMELEHENDVEEFDPQFRIDGHPSLVQHLRNAKEYPTVHGISLWKGGRESPNKVDLATCAVGARMLRRIVLNVGKTEAKRERSGVVW